MPDSVATYCDDCNLIFSLFHFALCTAEKVSATKNSAKHTQSEKGSMNANHDASQSVGWRDGFIKRLFIIAYCTRSAVYRTTYNDTLLPNDLIPASQSTSLSSHTNQTDLAFVHTHTLPSRYLCGCASACFCSNSSSPTTY